MGNNADSFPRGSPLFPTRDLHPPRHFLKFFVTRVRNSFPVAGTVCRSPVAKDLLPLRRLGIPACAVTRCGIFPRRLPGWAAGGCPRASCLPPRHSGTRAGRRESPGFALNAPDLPAAPSAAGEARMAAEGRGGPRGSPAAGQAALAGAPLPLPLSRSFCGCEKRSCGALKLFNFFITLTSFFLSFFFVFLVFFFRNERFPTRLSVRAAATHSS